jgi:type IV secretion system protein VirB2
MKHYPTMKWLFMACIATTIPEFAYAAGSPFATGATGLQADVLTILTPIAVIAVMAIGAAAWFNKISWWWLVAALVGTVLVFGSQQIVDWIRGLFGV